MKNSRLLTSVAVVLNALCITILLGVQADGIGIAPQVAGNSAADSIYVTIVSIDTTFYPEVAGLDSLDILRYKPDGSLLDSTSENASNVLNLSKGYYRVAFRASDATGTKGVYTVVARGWLAGKERGIASGAYEIVESAFDQLLASVSSIDVRADSIKDTVDSYLAAIMSSIDTAAFARSVWDDDITVSTGRRIGYADTTGTVLNIPSAGTGAYACSLFYFDAADTTAIQGIASRAMNNAQTATSGIGVSNTDGLVVLSLDAATYRIWSSKSGYSFSPLPDSAVVTSPSVVDTIWGNYFDPGSPPLPFLCRVYGWIEDLSGAGINGATVTANVRKTPLRYGSVIVSPYFRSTVTDTSGYWYLDLIPSGDLDPSTTSYTFSIYYQTGVIAVKDTEVPDLSSWELNW